MKNKEKLSKTVKRQDFLKTQNLFLHSRFSNPYNESDFGLYSHVLFGSTNFATLIIKNATFAKSYKMLFNNFYIFLTPEMQLFILVHSKAPKGPQSS